MDVDVGFYRENPVYRSWANHTLSFAATGLGNESPGFRKPQRAAAFAVLSHLDSEPEVPAVVVMPTGTGKTDTIFATMLAGRFRRTLLIVPTDALRTQIGGRLASLQRLRDIHAITDQVLSPVVHCIDGRDSALESQSITSSNVAIATPSALARLTNDELRDFAAHFSHLVFDEAHHVAAATWGRIRNAFGSKPAIHFTATPFREDQKRLNGKIIFNYSLSQAQVDNYFQKIEFFPVREYVTTAIDRTIALKAVELLSGDIEAGFDHILIARCATIAGAKRVFNIYRDIGIQFEPVIIHSRNQTTKERDLNRIHNRSSRIVVCVDMFGEGFDLPELKIAAIHDKHQSPAVTLQFIGRLTRTDSRLGTAKFVANVANQRSDSPMRRLYEENSDWSLIIREVSGERIGKELQRQEFEARFEGETDGAKIAALNPSPNTSCLAYRLARSNWHPNEARNLGTSAEVVELFSTSDDRAIVMVVSHQTSPVEWAKSDSISSSRWNLYLAYFRETDSTLFISSTGDERQTARFQSLIAPSARRINGDDVFRVMSGINRLRLQNVGLTRSGRDVRFTMHVGQDVNRVIGDLENGRVIKSNIFGTGYANGEGTTAGCSAKGKLWKMDSGTINEWVDWCDVVAAKINDPTIDTASILRNVMRAEKIVGAWPDGIFFVDWPDAIGIETEGRCSVTLDGASWSLLDTRLGTPVKESDDTLAIALSSVSPHGEESLLTTIRVHLDSDGYHYSSGRITLRTGTSEHLLSDYLDRERMRMLQSDGSIIVGDYRYFSHASLSVLLPHSLLSTWDWGSTNIHKESMSHPLDFDSVQGFTFQKICDGYDIIFNDDGAGEIADLVAVREMPDHIVIDLYHCKYCGSGQRPGARVDDAYVVAGQASRSAKWLHKAPTLFQRLMDRYSAGITSGTQRLLKGTPDHIDLLRHKSRDVEVRMGFFIVQPAFSASAVTDSVMTVLGTSYMYLRDIADVDLRVLASP
ncbi:DEAD/DEAH box helicase family protein [Stenotrophomonas sp. PS02289]|uniref:DEAD/DEAH box helicase n=1 Tax=Stenotrophomonas sp. PS02289 TaxID=2991422 RepID=UPI002499EB21|nr:DEAD/DEAH box helicase family protein [Stenotrophomonas sp. PS02289]